jgi:hypothetical protein
MNCSSTGAFVPLRSAAAAADGPRSAPPPLRNAEAVVLDPSRNKIDMFLATHIPLTYQFCAGSDPLCRYLYATRIRALAVAPTGASRAGVRFPSPLQDLWFPTTTDEQFYLDEPYVKALAHVVSAPSMAYFVDAERGGAQLISMPPDRLERARGGEVAGWTGNSATPSV